MISNRQTYWMPMAVALVLSLALLKLPDRTATQIKLAMSGLFLPLFGLASAAQGLTATATSADTLASRTELLQNLETLRKENDQLRLQLAQASSIFAENTRLHKALQLPPHAPWNLKLAHVVGRDPANWWRTIRIDAGLRQGIPTNAPVLTADGLVGRVSQVGYSHAQIVLLGDPDCRVSALIEETRDHGVLAPDSSSPVDNILVDMNYLSRNSPLKVGQRVITSGYGGIFPKGILIGKIVDFHSVDLGLYNAARVSVAARLNALEEVWVLVP